MIVHTYFSSYKENKNRRTMVKADPVRPYLKTTKAKRAGGVAQVVERYLASTRH
jgi:hypothetical protein